MTHGHPYEPPSSTEPLEKLMAEIERYVDAIELFRALGHEPSWRLEGPSELVVRVRRWLEPCEPRMSGA
jgi:hypothetical protein